MRTLYPTTLNFPLLPDECLLIFTIANPAVLAHGQKLTLCQIKNVALRRDIVDFEGCTAALFIASLLLAAPAYINRKSEWSYSHFPLSLLRCVLVYLITCRKAIKKYCRCKTHAAFTSWVARAIEAFCAQVNFTRTALFVTPAKGWKGVLFGRKGIAACSNSFPFWFIISRLATL